MKHLPDEAAKFVLDAIKEVVRISDRKHDAWDKARIAITIMQAAIDAQQPSGEREALIQSITDSCNAHASDSLWPHSLLHRTADMLAADAPVKGVHFTDATLMKINFDQAMLINDLRHKLNNLTQVEPAQQVAVPQGWANMPAKMQISIDELKAEVAIYQQGCDLRDAKIAELNSLLTAVPKPALADVPEQKPFGYWHSVADQDECEFFLAADVGEPCPHCMPVYATPKARELSDAKIDKIAQEQDDEGWFVSRLTISEWRGFARAVLAARSEP